MTFANVLYIVQGVGISLQYTFIALFIGCLLGLIFACGQFSRHVAVKQAIKVYIAIFRGTPLLVQLSLFYFALPSLTGMSISAFTAGIIAFSLNSTAYVTEILRGGIQSIDKGQFKACQTLGISKYHTLKDIILPQAFRATFPALTNEMISLLKETALISTIGETDIMRRAHIIAAENYNYLQPLIVAGICYYVLALALSHGAKQLEKRYHYDSVPATV